MGGADRNHVVDVIRARLPELTSSAVTAIQDAVPAYQNLCGPQQHDVDSIISGGGLLRGLRAWPTTLPSTTATAFMPSGPPGRERTPTQRGTARRPAAERGADDVEVIEFDAGGLARPQAGHLLGVHDGRAVHGAFGSGVLGDVGDP